MRISAITKDPLYRDDAPGMSLPCAIDHAHAAAADLFENFVISQEPGLGWRVHFSEDGLKKRVRNVVTAFQPLAQEAAHANSVVEPHGCSTFVAFCVLFGSVLKRIGAWI
jgi:hypothetical protein